MITIQYAMLVALGFLIASLLALAVAPAYRRRIVRLTTEAIRLSVPITEAEIRADKDRLRAQYAIRVHKLEAQGEQQRAAAGRQLVELNRRDARIATLEGEIEELKAHTEESANARRVLEHTISDSLPRLEQRLAEARQLLLQRDQEVTALNSETVKSVRALDEAMQVNAQQRSDIERLSSALASRAAHNREGLSDPRFDSEIAFKAEVEALRAKSREQASLISRIQGSGDKAVSGSGAEVESLKQDLAEAEAALKSVRKSAEAGTAGRAAAETKVAALKAKVDDQTTEIAQLKAALAAHEGGEQAGRKDSKVAAKARVSSLQAQVDSQNEIIQRLRAEVASGNERLARQAAHFMDELRRIGAGTLPASGDPRRAKASSSRRSLAERISHAKPAAGVALVSSQGGTTSAERSTDRTKVAEYLKALSDPAMSNGSEPEPSKADPTASTGSQDGAEPANPTSKRKPKLKLMQRISGLGKG